MEGMITKVLSQARLITISKYVYLEDQGIHVLNIKLTSPDILSGSTALISAFTYRFTLCLQADTWSYNKVF